MEKKRPATSSKVSIPEQIKAFEQANPRVSSALELFGESIAKYQGAITSTYGPRVVMTNSTAKKTNP